MTNDKGELRPESYLVWAGRTDRPGDPLNVPPVLASNYVLGAEAVYSRDTGSPTWEALEAIVGGLEGGDAVVFSSGMAAVAAVFEQVATGGLVALPDGCYQGVAGLAEAGRASGRWQIATTAPENTAAWQQLCAYADLIWLESPSNPLLVVADVVAICAAPRKPDAILAVDNTFATPLNQRPLALGADVSVQSATKFIGGHSDLLAGVVSTSRRPLYQAIRRTRELTGATPGAFETFLAVRGARTMALRLEKAQQTALVLAERLEAHAAVSKVRYPGLRSHASHEIAKSQLNGFGTVIAFDVRGDAAMADAVCANVALVRHATSLGGVESTIERRGAHAGQERVPPSLLRMSVGIENAEDLWTDLEQALNAAC